MLPNAFNLQAIDPFPIGRSVQLSERFGGRLQLETPLFKSAKLLWGTDYSDEDLSETLEDFGPAEFDASGFRVLRKTSERVSSPNFNINSLGLSAQAEFNLSDRWIVSGGLRHERFTISIPDYVNANNDFIGGGDRDPKSKSTTTKLVFADSGEIFSFPLLASMSILN